MISKKSIRAGFGETITVLAPEHPELYVACADLADSLKLSDFRKNFPDQFVEVGVAEQNLAGISAGIAMNGKTVFATSYATFNPGRNWEQIRTAICLQNLNVKIIGSHAGLATGADGATHQSLEDLALMRVLPNMTVIVPADYYEAQKATQALVKEHLGPAYLRLARPETNLVSRPEDRFVIGRAIQLADGHQATIIACGLMVELALQAAARLAHENQISVRVLNMHTIKPIDVRAILAAADETGAIVTVEEHQIHGGLGSAVAEVVTQNKPVPMQILGVNDLFGESGQPEELFLKYGLTTENIMSAVQQVIDRKS